MSIYRQCRTIYNRTYMLLDMNNREYSQIKEFVPKQVQGLP